MKSIVTGCAGFIGSHLSEALLEEGHEVIGIDSFTDYYSRDIKKRNIQNATKNEKFKLMEMNVKDVDSNVMKGVDFVFHLAAQPGVRKSWEKFNEYVKNNIIATQHLLEMCKGRALKKFVFASSSSVYGNAINMGETSQVQPVSPYGVTKLTGENLCNLYFSSYNVPTVILRYFSVYGPRQRPDMAFNIFISKIAKGEKITIFGNGEQIRDFTFVGDVVNATILAAEKDCVGETINVGGNSPVKLNDAIQTIEDVMKKKANIEYIEKQRGDPDKTNADITKAKNILGYKQKTDLTNGLKLQVSDLIKK